MSRSKLSVMIVGTVLAGLSSQALASEREELHGRAEALRKEAAALAERGHPEEAERLERHALDLIEAAERRRIGGDTGRPPELVAEIEGLKNRLNEPERMRKLEEVGRRIKHFRIAAEHLHEAGAHDFAAQLIQKAEILEEEARRAKGEWAKAEHRHATEHPDGLSTQIEELRREMKELRAEIEELRRQVRDR